LSTRKHGLNLLVGFSSSSKQGQLFFFIFHLPCGSNVSQALLSSASEVKVGWRAAKTAAAGSWAGNDPPVIIFQTFFKFLVT